MSLAAAEFVPDVRAYLLLAYENQNRRMWLQLSFFSFWLNMVWPNDRQTKQRNMNEWKTTKVGRFIGRQFASWSTVQCIRIAL